MHQELQDIGLSEKEARVYMASLELGRATADQLSKHAKILRPTTYVQIKSLMAKGLMSTYDEGKKTYFAPESPENLRRIFEIKRDAVVRQEKELTDVLPNLTQLFESAGERPVVRFFEGKEGITTLRNLALEVKSKEHSFVYSYEGISALYSLEERRAYSTQRVKNGIRARSILSTKESETTDIPPITRLLAIPAEKLPINTDMLVWDDNLSIVLYGAKSFGVLIHSMEVAKSFQATFNLLWEQLEKKYEVK